MIDEFENEVIYENGTYRCPCCGSKKITEYQQCVIYKYVDINTRKIINPYTGKKYMSNKEKAHLFNIACTEDSGCWNYICRKCGWTSDLCVE